MTEVETTVETPAGETNPEPSSADNEAMAVIGGYLKGEPESSQVEETPTDDVSDDSTESEDATSDDKESSEDTAPKLTNRQLSGAKALGLTPEEAQKYDPLVLDRAGKIKSDATRIYQGLPPKHGIIPPNESGKESPPDEFKEVTGDDVLEVLESEDGEDAIVKQINDLQLAVINERKEKESLLQRFQEQEEQKFDEELDDFYAGLNKEDFKCLGVDRTSELPPDSVEKETRDSFKASVKAFQKTHLERTGESLSLKDACTKAMLDVLPEQFRASQIRKAKRAARASNSGSIQPPNMQAGKKPASSSDEQALKIIGSFIR